MFKIESYRKGIILSTIFNVFNKGLVFLNGIVVAYFFGTGQSTDIFFFVYNSLIIVGAFVLNMNASVVIPESMRIRMEVGEEKSIEFLNFFIYLYTAITISVIVIISLNPVTFFTAISKFDSSQVVRNKNLLLLSLPLFCMIIVINLLIDILASYKYFTMSMIVGIINGCCSIGFILLFHWHAGIKSAFYGFIIAYVINLILMLYMLNRFLNWKFTFRWPAIERRVWKNLGFAQFGNLTSTLSSYTPIYILSGFNPGILAALTFAQQISALPNALITTQFSSVAGIKFNELYSAGDYSAMNKVFSESANFLHFLMMPLGFFMFAFSSEIVQTVLGFTSLSPETSQMAATFLKYLGFMLPLMVINTLVARLFMASHQIHQSFIYQVLFNVVLISCLYLGVRFIGIAGYPLAMVFTYFLNVLFCHFLRKKYFDYIRYLPVLKKFALLILVNTAIISAVIQVVRITGLNIPAFTLLTASTLYFLILTLVNKAFNINDLVTLHLGGILKKILSYGTARSRQ